MKSSDISKLLLPAALNCDALLLSAPQFVGVSLEAAGEIECAPDSQWVNQGFSFDQRHISFRGSDLNSRVGFKEGKLLEPLLETWATSRGWKLRESYNFGAKPVYLDYRYLLYKGVQRYLAGEGSPRRVEDIRFVASSSTPIRGDDGSWWIRPEARKEAAHVPVKELIKLADDSFPVRSEAWLRVFSGVSLSWSGGSAYTYVRGGNLDAAYTRKVAGKVADIFEGPCGVLGADAWSLYLDLAASSSFVDAVDAAAGALAV